MKAFLYSILCLLFCLQAGILRAQEGEGSDSGTGSNPTPEPGISGVQVVQSPAERSVFALGETLTFALTITEEGDNTKTYSWRKVQADGNDEEVNNGQELELIIGSLADSGRYYCIVTDVTNSSMEHRSDTVTIFVEGIGSVSIANPPDGAFNLGETVTFTLNITEAGTIEKEYLWKRIKVGGDEILPEATGNSLTLDNLSLADTGRYYCVVTDKSHGNTEYASDVISVRVEGIVAVRLKNPPAGALAIGGTFTLELNIEEGGDHTKSYSWRRVNDEGEDEILAVSGESLIFQTLSLADTGRYYCIVTDRTDSYKTYFSDTAIIRVTGIASIQVQCDPDRLDFVVGEPVTFTLGIIEGGNSSKTYSWRKVGDDTPIGNQASLTLPDLLLSHTGSYYCVVTDQTNPENPYYSDQRAIQVEGIGSVQVEQLSGRTTFVLGESIAFAVTVTQSGVDNFSYAWKKAGNGESVLSTESSLVLNDVSLADAGRYYCEVTDNTHPSAVGNPYKSNEYTIDVLAISAKVFGFTRLCVGDSARYALALSSEGEYTYRWFKVGGSSTPVTTTTWLIENLTTAHSGKYYCLVRDVVNGFEISSDTLDVLVSEYPVVGLTVNGTSPANRTATFCYDSDVSLAVVNQAPGQPEAIVFWTGTSLQGDPEDVEINFRLKYTSLYRAVITNNGCIREDSVRIVMKQPQVMLPESRYAITGESVTLASLAPENPDYRFYWNYGGQTDVFSGDTYTFTAEEGTTLVSVKVQTFSEPVCTNYDTCSVTGLPVVNYTTSINDGYVVSRSPLRIIQNDTVLCARTDWKLEVAYTGYDGYTYEWLKVGAEEVLATGRILALESLEETNRTDYFCRAYDLEKGGYVYSDTVAVVVKYRPVASITGADEETPLCGGYPLTLTGGSGLVNDPPAVTYHWQGAGMMNSANSKVLNVKISTDGYYSLIVSANGCSDTAELHIPTIVHYVDIPAQLILPSPTNGVHFTAEKPEDGYLTWFIQGTSGERMEVETGTTASASLNIRGGDKLVIAQMHKNGCDFRDTCRVLIREFAEPIGNESDYDDGFAISYPDLRVTNPTPMVCRGQDVTLSVYNEGYDNYKYKWYKEGVTEALPDSEGSSYTIYRARAGAGGDGGRYYCVATDPAGRELVSNMATLTVQNGPLAEINFLNDEVIDRSGGLIPVCYGSTIYIETGLSYVMSGGGSHANPEVADKLLWTGEGIVSGQGTDRIEVKVGNTAYFTLTASKNAGCSSQDTITFRVVKPEVSLASKVLVREEDAEITFNAASGQTVFTWFKNGEQTPDENATATMLFDADGYVVVTVGEEGCLVSDTAKVFIRKRASFAGGANDGFSLSRPALVIPGTLKQIAACPDEQITLHTQHAEYSNYKYEWWREMNGYSPQLVHTGAVYTFTMDQNGFLAGRYYCTVINPDFGEDDPRRYLYSDTLEITHRVGPFTQISPNKTELCAGELLELDATASASGAGQVSYTWSGEGVTEENNGASGILSVYPQRSGVYSVEVRNQNCSDTASIAITVSRPQITLPALIKLPAPAFNYDVSTLRPEGVATVIWSFRSDVGHTNSGNGNQLNIDGDGWIVASLQDAESGCAAVDSCRVFVKDIYSFGGGADDGFSVLEVNTRVWMEPRQEEITLCLDQQLLLRAAVSGVGRYTYSWHRVEDDVAGKPGKVLGTEERWVIDYITDADAGSYYCIVTDQEENDLEGGGKKQYRTENIRLIVTPGPIAKIAQLQGGVNWSACVGETIELLGSLAPESPVQGDVQYTWSGDYFEESETPEIIYARPRRDGLYILKISHSQTGCADTVHARFLMRSPQVSLPSTITMLKPGMLQIEAESNEEGRFQWYRDVYPSNILSYVNPANLDVKQDASVIVRFDQDGCYGFDTTQVFVRMDAAFRGGDDDGFLASDIHLVAQVGRKRQEVCRGALIEIPLRVAEVGRVLRYNWFKVGDYTVRSREKNLVLPANEVSDGGQYYCVVSDPSIENLAKGSVWSDTATVVVLNGPQAKISEPNEIRLANIFCKGVDVLISAQATESRKTNNNDVYTYEWFGENISYVARDYEINAKMGNNGRYIVKASMDGCSTYDTIDIKIYEPEIELTPVIYLSKPGPVSLSVNNPEENVIRWYQYTQGGYSVGAPVTGNSWSANILEDSYVVAERIKDGCLGYDTSRIFVKSVFSFLGGEEDGFMSAGSGYYNRRIEFTDYICEGDLATLFVQVVGDDFYRYKWVKVGDESREFTSSSLCKIENVKKSDEGYYYCIITDVNNSKTLITDRIYMHVKEKPRTSITIPDTEICYGQMAVLKADISSLATGVNYSYLWSGKGAASATDSVLNVQVYEAGDYVLYVSDGDCFTTDTISLNVRKTHLDIPTEYHIKQGDRLILHGKVNGSPAELLNWQIGNNPYRDRNPLVLESSSLSKTQPFTVSTAGKCVVTVNGMIYVRENTAYFGGYDDGFVLPNDLPQVLDQCGQLLGCDVDTALLWVKVVETEDLTVRWEKFYENLGYWDVFEAEGKSNVSGFENDSLVFTSIMDVDEGRYRCRLQNAYGTVFSREIRLVKGGIPQIIAPLNSVPICEKNEISFITDVRIPQNGTRTGLTWKWYFSKDGLNFAQLLPVADFTDRSMSIPDCRENNEGYYRVEASNYCGSVLDTAFQEVWEKPRFVAQPTNQYVCDKGLIRLTTAVEGGGTYTYALWQVEVDAQGKYVRDVRRVRPAIADPSYTFTYVMLEDDGYYQWRVYNECDSTRSNPFHLIVEEEIRPNFTAIDTTLCVGFNERFTLSVNNSNVANPTSTMIYYWTKQTATRGETNLSGTGTKHELINMQDTVAGVYICYVKHSCAAKPIKQYNIKTHTRPKITLDLTTSPIEHCLSSKNISMFLDYTSDATAGEVKFTWSHNNSRKLTDDGHYKGTTTPRLTIDSLLASDNGTYSVVLENVCGTTLSGQATVRVKMPPAYTRTLADQSTNLCVGENLALRVEATGEAPIMYIWTKGNDVIGSNSPTLNLNAVTHDFTGTYCCEIQNECTLEGVRTCAEVDVITPHLFDLQIVDAKGNVLKSGGYCAEDFLDLRLSGFDERAVYTLKRRTRLDNTNYTTLAVVSGATAGDYVSFGKWGEGYYHVEAEVKIGNKSCKLIMKNVDVHLFQHPTPKVFPFYVSDPICGDETEGALTLAGTENNLDVKYSLQYYNARYSSWIDQKNQSGTGSSYTWPATSQGAYRMIAQNTVSGCTVLMGQDTLIPRPYPVIYDFVALRGDTTACFNMESDVVLQLKNSESGTGYTLMKKSESGNWESTGRYTTGGDALEWEKLRGGEYTVWAESNYGCRQEMGNIRVTDLPQLEVYSLQSGIVYCEEQVDETFAVVLEGSTKGIQYDFYARSNGSRVHTAVGTDSSLIYNVVLNKDETYYVVATDVAEGCKQAMNGETVIEANHLTIAVDESQTIDITTSTILPVSIQGEMGAVSVAWQPSSRIRSVDPETHYATTRPLDFGEQFLVTVKDDFCTKEAVTRVNVVGQALVVEIRKSDCYTPFNDSQDTLFLCRGEAVNLCAYMSGGTTYQIKWTDDYYSDSIPNSGKSKLSYTRQVDRDGFIVFHARAQIIGIKGDVVTQEKSDTLWVKVREIPAIQFGMEDLTCVVPGEEAAIVLSDSEEGVEYALSYRPAANARYTAFGEPQTSGANGEEIRFPIEAYSDTEHAGYYQVTARKTHASHDATVCVIQSLPVELRRAPRTYTISGNDRELLSSYCAGDSPDSIYVSSSEVNVTYRLMRQNLTTGSTAVTIAQATGTGEELLFTGSNGMGGSGGNKYGITVVAVLGRCSAPMDNMVTIDVKARPGITVQNVEGMKNFCDDKDEIKVVILDPKNTVTYTLYKDGFDEVIAQDAASWDSQTIDLVIPRGEDEHYSGLIGSYTLVALDPANLCTDTVRGLVVSETPGQLSIYENEDHEYVYCPGEAGVDGTQIRFTGANPLIPYQLRKSNSDVVGNFIHTGDGTIYYDGILTVPDGSSSITYEIHALVEGCPGKLGGFTIRKGANPGEFSLLGSLLGCDEISHNMGVKATSVGYTYTLYKEGGDESLGDPQPGGGDIYFESQSSLGTYYVILEDILGCTKRLTEQYVIRPRPDMYRITTSGDSTYCEGSQGIQLGIENTQQGIVYTLQREELVGNILQYRDIPGIEIIGTSAGGASTFGGYYTAGKYRIRTDYCNITMPGVIEVIRKNLPLQQRLAYSGSCVDSSMYIEIATPEPGTQYTLLFNGASANMEVLSGTVNWTIAKAQDGIYTVLADRQGCTLLMEDEIVPGTSPKIGDLLGIAQNLCHMTLSDLYLSGWDEGSTYKLYVKGDDTKQFSGVQSGDSILFTGVPAGFNYYISATHRSCTIEKGAFEYPGKALPKLLQDMIEPIDCQRDGEGIIKLKNLKPSLTYLLSGALKTDTIKNFSGDTLLQNLTYGAFTLTATDPVTTCVSLPLEVTLRRGVPADSIISRLQYCVGALGVQIQLSGQNFGVTYSLCNAAGEPLGAEYTIQNTTSFVPYLKAGTYIFRKERLGGLWSGCKSEETFVVEEYPIPNNLPEVELPSGTLCEAGNNRITIHNSEPNVHYMLQNTTTNVYVDTIYGNGGTIVFEDRKPKGTYRLQMRYGGLCPATYYRTIEVSDVPPAIVAADCEYCYDHVSTDGCELAVSGLRETAEYILYNAEDGLPRDTLYGVNAGYFDAVPEGNYYVTGTYANTSCADVVAQMSVHRLTEPIIYTVANANGTGDCGTSAEIILQDGWEGDSVKYTLYLNGFLKMAGPITATQFGVRFPVQNAPGTYTVYATKGVEEKCGVWMNGQVVLYAPPANGVLSVRGYNCDEALATDVSKVTISATKAERNWFYYITDGIETSEKKAGLPNVQLSWDQINGRPLASGHYYLYADNGCGNNILMDSVWVRDAVTPAPVSLLRRKNGVFCNNWSNGYECILNTSERLVTYELAFSSTTYKAEGTGAQLAMGFAPSGLVSVYATSDTTGCTYLMDTLRVVEDYYTSNPGFSSSDICSNEGGTITITMGQPRVPQRDYYLRVNGHNVDTIPAETNGSVLSFKPQNELGCYELYTTSKTGQCDTVYPARCLSLGPEPRTLKGSEWDGKLCQGDLFKVVVETPQPGVYYQLFRNGTPHTSPVQGFGDTLLVGTIATAGEYTVKAFVTDACSIDLETVFRVEVLPRPELNLVTEYVYPQGGEGVEIVVDAPTSEGVWYQIEQNGSAIDWRQAFGASLSLGQGRKAGVYVIKTFELSNPRFQCVSQDTVVVKELGLENFTLGVVGTPYKCDATECRVLRLSGTEKGVTYQLHRRTIAGDQFIAELVGNGRSMDFNQQCDTGFYYVIAAHRFTDPNTGQEFTASSQMGDGVRLYTSTRINKYLLESETQGYCHRSGEAPSGSVLCSGSQSEVTYYLYRDGNLVPGQERYGNGSPLRWGSLEGKPCINNSDDGYVYTVRATDGRCEVQMAGEISIIATNQPAIRKQTYSLNECTGSTVAMAADVTGCLLTYEWRFNGQVVSRESSHVIEDLQQEDMGTYECTVSNYCGSVNLQPIPVEVRGVVTVPDQLTDAMVCGDGGSPIELVSGATGENAQYSWYLLDDEAHPVSSDRIYTIENPVKSLHEGVYVCKTWNTCGAVFDTVRLDFNREPVVEGFIFREQTLCKGSSWQIELTSPDTLFWYHNDVLIPDKKSRSLKFDSIVPVNEGLYKVVAKNICNQKEFNIVRLLVDDTLYVASAFEKEKHYCNRSPIEMAIMLRTPEGTGLSRVNYFWTKREMPIANAVTNQYTVGSSLADDGVVFAVYYNNACTSGDTSQTVYIDQPVDLKNLTADVIECTTVPGMTQIQVIDQAQDDPSYNKYSWYKQGTPDVLVGETAFLQVERKVVNSGKYYSIVENACSRATSTVMNLWIDSIPVITQQPQSAEACANQTLILYTQSTGGNVEYRWYVRKRGEQNGSLLSTYRRQEYSSQSQLTREMLTLDYDSCQIWCTVENGCGYVSTDTIVIRVKPEVTLLADRTLASLCSNASDEVKVVLRTSDPACTWWRYQRSDAGSLVNVFGSVTDTLRFTQAGEYVISDFAPGGTAFKCYKKDVRIEISIQERELFYASLERIGKETICRGEKVQLRLKIEGGEAPWRVDIRRASDRRPAPEVGGVPVEVWSRDTTFNLQLIDNQEFYIESVSQFQDPNACVGEIAGNSVSYIVEHAYGTYLGIRSGDTKDFGVCNNIDLSAVLKPYPAYPVGKFYVNGQLLEGNQLNGLSVGAHDILYKAVTPAGCADSVSETLHIHAAPGANFFTDKNALCTGETAHLTLEFSGTGPFTYSGRTYSYNSSGGVIGRPLTWGGTVDNYMTSSVFFDEKITADSMRKYELMSVKDAFGCTANVDNSIQLLFHYSPKLYVQVSNINYNNGAYTEAGKTFTVPTGSRVNFRFGPRPQITPWNGYITYTNPMGVVVEYQFLNQTVKELTRYYTDMPGLWNFTISDSYCPSTSPIEKEIISLDTGYLQVSVMLQGAYVDDGQGKMQSKLWPNQLPKKTWGVWPSLGGRTAIDWIILELRTGSVNGSKFYSGEFLLLDDGTIIDRAGRSTLPIPLADFVTDYYIVVKHRNHLAIGSSRGHKLASSASAASLVDLSLSANIHVDNTQGDMTNFIKFLGVFNGKQRWAMYAGNVLENSLISIANPNTALLYEKSTDGYYLEDVNFDGKVTIPINLQSPSDNSDVSIMFKNRFIYSLIVE